MRGGAVSWKWGKVPSPPPPFPGKMPNLALEEEGNNGGRIHTLKVDRGILLSDLLQSDSGETIPTVRIH